MALHEAARLNELGSSFLADGKYDSSYRCLSMAATTLQGLLNEDEPEEGMTEEVTVSGSFGPRIAAFRRSDFHVFSCDFQFEVSQSSPASRATFSQKRFCIANVLFNMALGRHAQAIQLGKDKALESVFKLYMMSLNVLQQVQGFPDCVILMTFAGLNNIAAVLHEVGESARSQEYLENLGTLASDLSPGFLNDDSLVHDCLVNVLLATFVSTARAA